MGLAVAESREANLLSIAAAARFEQRLRQSGARPQLEELRQDRAWLTRLISMYGDARPHGSVLDPAAWAVRLKLDQSTLKSNSLVALNVTGLDIYLDQVFAREDEKIAAAILPELLWHVEPRALLIWQILQDRAAQDQSVADILAVISTEWFAVTTGVKSGAEGLVPESVGAAADSLAILMAAATVDGPPDAQRLAGIRYGLNVLMPELDGQGQAEAAAFLHLSDLLEGLNERRYYAFAEGLLSVVSGLLEQSQDAAGRSTVVAAWMTEQLPGISASYARAFAAVDPRLNSVLAAAFDVAQSLSRPVGEAVSTDVLKREIADAVAQLALLIPDLDYYFELPVRDPIAGAVDACIGMMARLGPDGSPSMTRELFDDCQESLVSLATGEARAASLSGDPDGPFGITELQREMSVTSGQRINYGIGYLHERYSIGCVAPQQPLPNPLEWAALATLMTWFAEQSPVYFQTPENEQRLLRMRALGYELLNTVAEQVDCFAGSGAAINDPISRGLSDYREDLVEVNVGIRDAIRLFRERTLESGADIALQLDAGQATAYRPAGLMIGPCDTGNVCEMSGQLSSTRALLGLFPDVYLIADQARYGDVEICYENMEWVERRSQLVREDDPNVANYHGKLAFDLKGRFTRAGEQHEVFGFRFTSPDEYRYLFAAATEDVLNDSCPMEWVGKSIVTGLRENRFGVVPNRLTYLAAPRMLPSRLLALHWDEGAEWRDWFITGLGVEPLPLSQPADISADVTQYLQSLNRAGQAAVYNSLQRAGGRDADTGIDSQLESVQRLTTLKELIRMQMMLFYPQLLTHSDEIRSSVTGQAGLLDSEMIARFREHNLPVADIEGMAMERLNRLRAEWRAQPEAILRTGSVAGGFAHAMMRLNALYKAHFAPVAAPVENAVNAAAADD